MKTRIYLWLLISAFLPVAIANAQSIDGPDFVCPGQTATYYFYNGSTFGSKCERVDMIAEFNGQLVASAGFDSPSNPTAFTVTWPNEPGTGVVSGVGGFCCLINWACGFRNASRNVLIGQFPTVTPSSYVVCAGGQVTLTATTQCSPSSYYWEAPAGWIFPLNGTNILPNGPAQVVLQAPASGPSASVPVITRAHIGTGTTTYTSTTLQFGALYSSQVNIQLYGAYTNTLCPNTSYTFYASAPPGTTVSNWNVAGTVSSWYGIGNNMVVVNTNNSTGVFVQIRADAVNACGSTQAFYAAYNPYTCYYGMGRMASSASEEAVVFPNPPTQNAPVTAFWPESLKVESVSLVNSIGEVVQTIQPKNNQAIFDTQGLPQGNFYMIKINTGKAVVTRKVFINK
jgi:hypothetical protein